MKPKKKLNYEFFKIHPWTTQSSESKMFKWVDNDSSLHNIDTNRLYLYNMLSYIRKNIDFFSI